MWRVPAEYRMEIGLKYKEVVVHMCVFDGIRRGNYFGVEPIARAEVKVRVGWEEIIKGNDKRWRW